MCGVLFGLEFVIIYIGLGFTTASRGLCSSIWRRSSSPSGRLTVTKLLGPTAAMLGQMLAMGEGLSAPGRPTLTGDVLCLLAAVLWGATTVLIRVTSLKSATPEKTLLYQLAVSGVMLRRYPISPGSRASSTRACLC